MADSNDITDLEPRIISLDERIAVVEDDVKHNDFAATFDDSPHFPYMFNMLNRSKMELISDLKEASDLRDKLIAHKDGVIAE